MSTVAVSPSPLAIELIDVGENTRELDLEHVKALAGSIALRGLIVPLVVRREGDRFVLVAGFHRYAAARSLGLTEVQVTVREQEGTSADSAAENVVRKALNPLEEARAVGHMLDEGYTLDGAATVLGWSRSLVGARAKILELPEAAQQLIGTGQLPVGALATVARIAQVSPELCEAVLAPIAAGEISGEQLQSSPGWVIGRVLRESTTKVFVAFMSVLEERDVQALRLGKRAMASYAQAQELHRKLDRHAYGPPPVRFADAEVDQARAAGVLIEFDHGTPVITDRALLRELAGQAIARTLQELRSREQSVDAERAARRAEGLPQRSPEQELESEHRRALRDLTVRAHGTNLDLGAALLAQLASVDPSDMDVARFFAYGLLGPDEAPYGSSDHTVATLAANGVRLVFEQHRTTSTATLKSGKPGATKVAYGDPADARAWMWRFLEGARSAGELYGRVLVLFAAQHYVSDLVLPASARRGSVLPRSRKDLARKSFERLVKPLLPATHVQLRRALEREARAFARRQRELAERPAQGEPPAAPDPDDGESRD